MQEEEEEEEEEEKEEEGHEGIAHTARRQLSRSHTSLILRILP